MKKIAIAVAAIALALGFAVSAGTAPATNAEAGHVCISCL